MEIKMWFSKKDLNYLEGLLCDRIQLLTIQSLSKKCHPDDREEKLNQIDSLMEIYFQLLEVDEYGN